MPYDYVIVGAGSAGCVLASRLTQDPNVSVCLIEAGPPDTNPNIAVPVTFGQLFRTEVDWDYSTAEEPNLHRRRIYLPRGRVLGGTSSINTMIYIRGNAADFNGWDAAGWSYRDLLPYFLRSEHNERGASAFHGVGGELAVSDNRSRNPMSRAFLAAAQDAGYEANDDFNGARQEGVGFFQLTQRDGLRASTAAAFLRPVMERPNLTVLTETRVHRVVLEEGEATGVLVRRGGQTLTIDANQEVILAAGAYNSPQLLQLSGIGPAPLLQAFGIPTVVDLPEVGQNLQDHVLIPLIYQHDEPTSLIAANTPENMEVFQNQASGPLTSNGPEVGGFTRTSMSLDLPDVEFLGAPVMFAESGLAAPTGHAFSFGPSMIAPRSRGRVGLALADPTAKPLISHQYFAHEEDMHDAVVATRLALDIGGQTALASKTTGMYRPPASDSDDDLRKYIRSTAHSIFHPAGTCAIGSVVDEDLRVLGAKGLRVVDASIMPTLVRGNPNAATIAIAERAADLIAGRQLPSLEVPESEAAA